METKDYIIKIKGQKIFAFADTHGAHRQLKIPEDTDIIICAGDAVEDDLKGGEYDDFLEWFSVQPGKYKIFVPGNHELSFDVDAADAIRPLFEKHGIILLEDEVDDFGGVVIGSISGNSHISDEDIPTDLDVLVTHYPPMGILDEGFGSPEILNFVLKAKPAYHLFGHMHKTGGKIEKSDKILFTNVCMIDKYDIMSYEKFKKKIIAHLGSYNKDAKGIYIYKGQANERQHILAIPKGMSKEEVIKQIIHNDGVNPDLFRNPQQFAHHLNSSQVVCYEFFRGMISDDGLSTPKMGGFLESIGIPPEPFKNGKCLYEYCPNKTEYTNFDFYIKGDGSAKIYFEIKYTENGFGNCSNDGAHKNKYDDIYRPMISECACLKKNPTFDEFRKYYQLFRNVLRVTKANGNEEYIVFLFPRENTVVLKQFHDFVDEYISNEWKDHIIEAHWEDQLSFMTKDYLSKFFFYA